jgi:hypothetical protein
LFGLTGGRFLPRQWTGIRSRTGYAPPMAIQSVEVKDFPGFTLDDALEIGTHRLTQQGYTDIEPMPDQPQEAIGGLWRLAFRVAEPPR